MADRVFAVAGDWALASDGVQWMLMRRTTEKRPNREPWQAVSFVRSEREILARGMREKGVGGDAMRSLLSGLPDTFDEWMALSRGLDAVGNLETHTIP
jgi:hypothetical protein